MFNLTWVFITVCLINRYSVTQSIRHKSWPNFDGETYIFFHHPPPPRIGRYGLFWFLLWGEKVKVQWPPTGFPLRKRQVKSSISPVKGSCTDDMKDLGLRSFSRATGHLNRRFQPRWANDFIQYKTASYLLHSLVLAVHTCSATMQVLPPDDVKDHLENNGDLGGPMV